MLKLIDHGLQKTTMYRVVLYGLSAISINALLFSVLGILSWSFTELTVTLLAISVPAIAAHYFLKSAFNAPANIESTLITSLILFFILLPTTEPNGLVGLALAGVIAVASKYILAWRKIHMFNPAAFAAVIVGATLIAPAIWWVGTPSLLPLTLIVGLLIVRKIHRFDLFLSVIVTSTVTVLILGTVNSVPAGEILRQHFLSWPIIFFASVMVTEPLTTPPRRLQRVVYGCLIGIVSSIPLHVGIIFSTPELTLVLANVGSFMLGLRRRLVLPLKEKRKVAKQTYDFIFAAPPNLKFLPGQFLEWTLPHRNPDKRGIRRYFTIASSPTENTISIGVKFPEKPSSFKQKMLNMKGGDLMYASQLAGDFVLPKDPAKPLVFIAGGIGVTPFRSIVKYMIDAKEKRAATLFLTCTTPEEFTYQDIFEKGASVGVKPVYVVTNPDAKNWNGEKGFIDDAMLKRHVKNIRESHYYISGPPGMVDAYKNLLLGNSVPRTHIKTDYFPGYA